MMPTGHAEAMTMLSAARWVLRTLNWLNWGVGVPIVLIGIVVGFIYPDAFLHAAAGNTGAPEALLGWLRIALPATAPIILFVHIIFTRLIAIIDSIGLGAGFSLANAQRLRTIAWALLGTQLIDLAVGLYSVRVGAQTGEYMGWGFGFSGWLAVLLLFVLAQFFRDGAAMRAELDGTI
jgi:hypothetical protein